MKKFLIGMLTIGFISCHVKPGNNTSVSKNVLRVHQLPAVKMNLVTMVDSSATNQQADAFADYYIVVADTGKNYDELKGKMVNLHRSSGIPIDTLGRYYNRAKDLIALPDSDEDEIYAGDYFPRREPSEHLSLEYMDFYKPGSDKKTIALVAGIYQGKKSADSLLESLPSKNGGFSFRAKVYVGCMH